VTRLAALAIAVVLALLMAACGGDDERGAGSEGEGTRIAVVTDLRGLDDRGFNALANQGLERAETELGVEGRVFISKSANDYVPNLTRAARDGYDLVIANGFLMGDALANVAARFPDTRFAIIDLPWSALEGAPQNTRGLVFAEQEAGYLVGVAAATVADGGAVGAVGGQEVPAVVAFLSGYRAGAKATDASVRVLEGYSQELGDPAKCKELALNQIDDGSKVVFEAAVGCGLGALEAAKDRSLWGIGVDSDRSFLGPHILTSATKKVDVAVFETVTSVLDGKFSGGGDTLFDIANGGVGYGKVSPNAPGRDALIDELDAVAERIEAGDIEIPRE
jgi:basic membrane protein A and related proteins